MQTLSPIESHLQSPDPIKVLSIEKRKLDFLSRPLAMRVGFLTLYRLRFWFRVRLTNVIAI
jgi:hypothetical protein